jgi:hypothetical protein
MMSLCVAECHIYDVVYIDHHLYEQQADSIEIPKIP